MAGISVWIYLRSRRTPDRVDNVTAVNTRLAVDTRTGATSRNLFSPAKQVLAPNSDHPSEAVLVSTDNPLPATFDPSAENKMLVAGSDEALNIPPQPVATKRDQMTLVTSPFVGGHDNVFYWQDEVLMVSNCDPDAVPANVDVWYVRLQGRRNPVPVVKVTDINSDTQAINQQQTYRNIFAEGALSFTGSTAPSLAFIRPGDASPTSVDDTSVRTVAVSDEKAGTLPRVLDSVADLLKIGTSDGSGTDWLGGALGFWAWRDEVVGISYRKAS